MWNLHSKFINLNFRSKPQLPSLCSLFSCTLLFNIAPCSFFIFFSHSSLAVLETSSRSLFTFYHSNEKQKKYS